MKLYSTNHKSTYVGLGEALFRGLPADNGLYMPAEFPSLPEKFYEKMGSYSIARIAYEVSKALLRDDLPDRALRALTKEAINFDAPVVHLNQNMHVQELFHGPTLAFKDFGARFMARLMQYLSRKSEKDIYILVATSGDTGSAVAHGFLGVAGIKVIVLYPKGKVSKIQEKQFTTLGQNILALEVDGNFDDCQRMVKSAFLDEELGQKLQLTSANSINIGRLIPQTFYYFYAYAKLKSYGKPLIFSVPSGNFGNLCAGLIAKKMGLPVKKFIAATNVNDVVPEFLQSGKFTPRPSTPTLSNAMDVGNPSNFVRIMDMYNQDWEKINQDIIGASFHDEDVKNAIQDISARYEYTLDPHSAIGYLGLEKYFKTEKNREQLGVILATAHPSKFIDVVEDSTGSKVIIPDRLRKLLKAKKKSILISNDFEDLKKIMLSLEERW
ncbi:MAG: threonine synthase [Candidatus Cyclobacteriaceae bacterium M3_2C_046]